MQSEVHVDVLMIRTGVVLPPGCLVMADGYRGKATAKRIDRKIAAQHLLEEIGLRFIHRGDLGPGGDCVFRLRKQLKRSHHGPTTVLGRESALHKLDTMHGRVRQSPVVGAAEGKSPLRDSVEHIQQVTTASCIGRKATQVNTAAEDAVVLARIDLHARDFLECLEQILCAGAANGPQAEDGHIGRDIPASRCRSAWRNNHLREFGGPCLRAGRFRCMHHRNTICHKEYRRPHRSLDCLLHHVPLSSSELSNIKRYRVLRDTRRGYRGTSRFFSQGIP